MSERTMAPDLDRLRLAYEAAQRERLPGDGASYAAAYGRLAAAVEAALGIEGEGDGEGET